MTLTKIASTGVEDSLRWVLGANGTSDYTFTGPGLTGTVNDPTIYLTRGQTYIFQNNSGGHPFYIKTSIANGGTNDAYNTGVTNNGGGNGTEIVFTVPHDSPDILYYQCSSHSSMAGQFNIAGSVADGSISTAKLADDAVTQAKLANNAVTTAEINNLAVTTAKLNDAAATTAKISDNAVTTAKIADNAVTTQKIANNAVTNAKVASGAISSATIIDANVTTAKIADDAVTTQKIAANAITTNRIVDQAVTLDKLPHGTSSNDGKFLRANNGADPTFETLPASGIPASGGTFTGDITVSGGTSAISVSGGSDIRFTNGTDTGVGTKIQHAGNVLRIGGGSNGCEFFNGNTGTSNWKVDGAGRLIPSFNNYYSLGDDGNHITKIFLSQGIQLTGNTNANLLDDYEEGTFTPNIQDAASGGNSHGNSGVREAKYTKIGNTVTVMMNCRSLSNSGLNGSHQLFVTNLPFRQSGVERAVTWAQVQYFNNVSNTEFGMHFQINANETIMRFHKMKDNQGANPAVTFNHWMYSNGYYGFATTFTYITDQ